MSGAANRRRFLVMSLRKFAVSPSIFISSRMAAMAWPCSSAENTGLFTRRGRSSHGVERLSEAVQILLDLVERILLERKLEQRVGVTARNA